MYAHKLCIFTLKLHLSDWQRGEGRMRLLARTKSLLLTTGCGSVPWASGGDKSHACHRMPPGQGWQVSAATTVSADPTQQLAGSFRVLSQFGIAPRYESCSVSRLPVIWSESGCQGWWPGNLGKFFSWQIISSKHSQDDTFWSPNLIRALRTQSVYTLQARQPENTQQLWRSCWWPQLLLASFFIFFLPSCYNREWSMRLAGEWWLKPAFQRLIQNLVGLSAFKANQAVSWGCW